MNILFLSTNDTLGGAATVTLRLVEALQSLGHDARMLVARKDTSHPFVERVNPLLRMGAKVAERVQVLAHNGFNRSRLWDVSTGAFGAPVASHPWVRSADAIVLGWISQGFLSLNGLSHLISSGKPLLWWMHDYWCATGICHIPGECPRFTVGCGLCPLLGKGGSETDLSARVFKRKAALYRNIRFMAVSRFQKSLVERSALAPAMGPVELLPHPFPIEDYYTAPRTGRFEHLKGEKLIVAGAANLNTPLKNMQGAVNALNILVKEHPEVADHAHAVFFGNCSDSSIFQRLDMPASLTGPLSAAELRELYASAAVVLSPSLSETMGATLMEGIASGAMAVSYDSGGPRDIIISGLNGFLTPNGDERILADAIGEALRMEAEGGAQGRLDRRQTIADRFATSAILPGFLSLLRP